MTVDDTNTVLAGATVILAIVTAAMAIATFSLARGTKESIKQAERHHQENRQQIQNREDGSKRQLWESIVVLAGKCVDATKSLLKNYPTAPASDLYGNFLRSYTPSDFDNPLEGLAAIPLHQVDNPALIVAVLEMRGVMGRITRHLDDVRANKGVMPFSPELVRAQGTPLFNAFADIMRIVRGQTAETEDEIRRRTSGL